jgi:decaprenylphospho-beta-D-ribofuranose 2-oxidase
VDDGKQNVAGVMIKPVSGWGRYPVQSCELIRPERYAELKPSTERVIVRGQGRSYGDASLNADARVILSERLNRILAFDPNKGLLRAEAGITLQEILEIVVPRGWFLPVTPGTKYASLGGCVAADVHGKNHHGAGSFSAHVQEIEMVLADGTRTCCAAEQDADLFWATAGGMGLTGIIAEVTLRLMPIESGRMIVQHRAANDLEAGFKLLDSADFDDVYTVAWIDCLARGRSLGRSIVMRAHHASRAELPPAERAQPFERPARRLRRMPFDLPSWVLNPLTVNAFNQLYYWTQGRKQAPFPADYDGYFYPLDAIADWNRLYGKKGFVQYQCVLPGAAVDDMRCILEMLAASRRASFLAVLKRFGAAGKGMLSFPCPGYTLALDLPVKDAGLFELLDRLDEIVLAAGGRVYLAKDCRLAAATFRAMYPRYNEWLAVKRAVDPGNRFSSSLSRRIMPDH